MLLQNYLLWMLVIVNLFLMYFLLVQWRTNLAKNKFFTKYLEKMLTINKVNFDKLRGFHQLFSKQTSFSNSKVIESLSSINFSDQQENNNNKNSSAIEVSAPSNNDQLVDHLDKQEISLPSEHIRKKLVVYIPAYNEDNGNLLHAHFEGNSKEKYLEFEEFLDQVQGLLNSLFFFILKLHQNSNIANVRVQDVFNQMETLFETLNMVKIESLTTQLFAINVMVDAAMSGFPGNDIAKVATEVRSKSTQSIKFSDGVFKKIIAAKTKVEKIVDLLRKKSYEKVTYVVSLKERADKYLGALNSLCNILNKSLSKPFVNEIFSYIQAQFQLLLKTIELLIEHMQWVLERDGVFEKNGLDSEDQAHLQEFFFRSKQLVTAKVYFEQ